MEGDDRLFAVATSFLEDLRVERELLRPVEQPEIQTSRLARVTVLDGKGWYTKENTEVLMVLTRKADLNLLLRYIRSIDPDAFLSVSSVTGVYGKGFDVIKKKM